MKFLKLPEVLDRRASGHSDLYTAIAAGTFVPPIARGRSKVWDEQEVEIMNAANLAGNSEDELRVLVRLLVEARKNRFEHAKRSALPQMEADAGKGR